MKIGILGAGKVGGALGGGLARAGHAIVYGVRDPADPKHAPLRDGGAAVATLREAAAGYRVIGQPAATMAL